MDVSTGNHNTQMDNTNGDPMNEVVQADANSPNPQRPTVTDGQDPSESVDAELEAMKKRLQQMEQETLGVHSTEDAPPVEGVDDGSGNGGRVPNTGGMHPHHGGHHPNAQAAAIAAGFAGVDEMTADSDARSIYVGNVDYNASGEELNQHFQECGTINRVTIMTHKATRQPKGYAYIEFKERESVQNALILNESMFRGRQLKVVEKRTNIPGVTRGGMGGRGRGRFQRGGWRGGFRGRPRGRGRGNGRGGRWAPPY